MKGGRGAEWTGIPGGKFSLGRLRDGSGYCVGAVVESRMEATEDGDGSAGSGIRSRMGKYKANGSGMKDVWVVGEGFFRGVGAVFDVIFPSIKWEQWALMILNMLDPSAESRVPDLLGGLGKYGRCVTMWRAEST